MTATVSKSPKPDDHELTRKERDGSLSEDGAGRKAVETAKPDFSADAQGQCKTTGDKNSAGKECLNPPIGLDSETKGDAEAKSCAD